MRLGIFISTILTILSSFDVIAQENNFVTNVTKDTSLDRKHLVVGYDLTSADTAQLFDVELKIYYGNRIIQPKAEELTGSWGYKIAPGKGKSILWDLPPELAGDIDLITASVIASKSICATADFDFEINSKTPPFEVKFNNKSTNSDKFLWEFGDPKSLQSNVSALESPAHRYRSAGNYQVGLITGNTRNKTTDTVIKVVSLVKNDQVRKHKNLKTVWLTSSVASAGIGVYGLIRHKNLYDEWKKMGTNDLEKKYKTYRIVGPAGLAVSAICISQVISQSKKVREAGKKISMNIIPLDNGLVTGLSINF